MTDRERVERYLRTHAGRSFCVSCLAHEVGVRPSRGHAAVSTIKGLAGYRMHGGTCVSCLRSKRVIRHVDGYFTLAAAAQVAVFLRGNEEIRLCAACVAFAAELSLTDVRGAMAQLTPLSEFELCTAACTVCGRHTDLMAAVAADGSDTDAGAQIESAGVAYRGQRIDLLSYRTAAGWRPFVLVKGAPGPIGSDAPSILATLLTTKSEADEAALRAAKAWIDTQTRGQSEDDRR